ncbi:MAG: quinone oxidoreductase [Candidatus Pelagibacter sp.]|nr:quinone oxidoreductase [Candidatus Pelagibacter sp.]OUW23313.1 MAG: quinone oxidoreductase [Rickettsiales bacterium TMED174]|tara:strand:- start:239 stop:1213 length:975 start_codon:yes stop_codon:yes gene_type:complete
MPKSIVIKKNGGPEVLELQETSVGEPGPHEIKVTNLAIGINYIDTYHRSGLYKLPLPSGIGLEAAAKIEKIGSEVKNFDVGNKIAYASMPIGAYSQQRIIPAKIAVKLPEFISPKIAATLMTKGLTTNYLICKTYKLKAGETVLFHAAAGGVGQIFAQWANSIGAKVIGTVGSDEKIKIAEKNGYDYVINYNKGDFAKEVLKITNNEGVPAVFDGVGKSTFKGSIACLKTRGIMVSFGNASGPLDPVDVPKDIQAKSLFFTRPSVGHYFTNQTEIQTGADEIFEKVKYGKLKMDIFKEYSLEDANKAHADLEARKLLGPSILIP